MTRTVAIIKTHALNHRFDIERRIQEASFEVSAAGFFMCRGVRREAIWSIYPCGDAIPSANTLVFLAIASQTVHFLYEFFVTDQTTAFRMETNWFRTKAVHRDDIPDPKDKADFCGMAFLQPHNGSCLWL